LLSLFLAASNFHADQHHHGVDATHVGTIPPLDKCQLCADGSLPQNLDTPLGLDLLEGYPDDDNPDSWPLVLGYVENLTCGTVAQDYIEKYRIYAPAYSSDCSLIQFAGIERCGCPDLRVNPCNLCEDENEHYNPDTVISDLYSSWWATCFDAAAAISYYAAGGEQSCSAYQATVGERCGCANPIAQAALECSLCGDRDIPLV
jgi:hypothetical protein